MLFSAGDAIDVEVLQETAECFDFNVTGCRYAKFSSGHVPPDGDSQFEGTGQIDRKK